MFNSFFEMLRSFLSRLRPWVIICPWQQAVRVRLGSSQKILGPGIHFRIPWADILFVQSVRLRITTLGRQTVSTADGQTITFCGSVGYSIDDIGLLYSTLHHAEDTIMNLVKQAIAEFIYRRNLAECSPDEVNDMVTNVIDLSRYGITVSGVYLTDFSCVRTFRLIGDQGDYQRGRHLDTEMPSMNESGAYATEGLG